jgi:dihydroorotase
VHVYTGEGQSYARGFRSVPPDGFTLESCTTTVSDAGSSGWRNFEDFKSRIIDQSKTRVTTFLNIVGHGMGGGAIEQNLADMEAKPTADMALKHKGVIVGIKSAHYSGPEWDPYIRSVEAGTIADIPVMVDFGSARVRTIAELFTNYFRPGDIYTHAYAGGGRGELIDGKVNPAIFAAQKKGIIFDIGHGGGSFVFRTAVQAFKEGFYPDSLSTDLDPGRSAVARSDGDPLGERPHRDRQRRDRHDQRHEGVSDQRAPDLAARPPHAEVRRVLELLRQPVALSGQQRAQPVMASRSTWKARARTSGSR